MSRLICCECGKKTKKLPYVNINKLPTGWTWSINGVKCSKCSAINKAKEHNLESLDVNSDVVAETCGE